MPDVLQSITSDGFKNGTAVVSIGSLGVVSNHTLNTVKNKVSEIPKQSGVLDIRLDEVRYYSGDTPA
jgi:hypothetical protein